MSLKSKYANALLNKKFGKLQRDISVFSFENAKNIGILWHLDDQEAYNFLQKKLHSGNIKLSSLCYTESKEEMPGSFGSKDANWLGFPKTEHVRQFVQTDFDLLINVSLNENFQMRAIATLSKARFKIGVANGETNYNDLSVDVSKNPNSLYLAQQLLYYLNELKINN